MTPKTCIERFPADYLNGFGRLSPTQRCIDKLNAKIASMLPDKVAWCGDELIADVDYEWKGNLDEIIGNAYAWLFENDDEDDWIDTASVRALTDEELASRIYYADEWEEDALTELCRRAGLESEWDEADGDTFEDVAFKAADILGVKII